MAVCPYCKDTVPEPDAWFCPTCDSAHHTECWDANHRMCSVYGCKSISDEILLGCPYCEEVSGGRGNCYTCGEPFMSASEVSDFLTRHVWEILPTEATWNPVLTAGFLRNNGITARISKKAPISMFGFNAKITVLVPIEQAADARALMQTLAEKFQPCPDCGHTLFIDEEECSYCTENSGAEP
jgi:hypothetical protein